MDNERLFEIISEIRERLARIEENMGIVKRLEARVCKLEAAPGVRWKTLTTAILTSLGSAIGGGIVAKFLFK
jgi:hypothetical protein